MRDLAYVPIALRPWKPLFRYLFRIEFEGHETLPEESFVFIANHNIGAAIEIMALLDYWHAHFKERPVYGLSHPFVFKIPGLRSHFLKIGGIPATFDAAFKALDEGASLLIFPGGNFEAVRPFSQRHRCDFGGHKGWAKVALEKNRRIIPISILGSHSVNPVLARTRWLSWALVIPRLLGIRYFPITVSQVIWSTLAFAAIGSSASLGLGLAAAYTVFVLSPLWPIWPAKIRIRFGAPMDLHALTSEIDDPNEKIMKSYERVTQAVQKGLELD